MKNLDEAILHYIKAAESNEEIVRVINNYIDSGKLDAHFGNEQVAKNNQYAKDNRQITSWLKQLKAIHELVDGVSPHHALYYGDIQELIGDPILFYRVKEDTK